MESINECQLNKFYKRRQQEMMMFTWVQCVNKNMPTVDVTKAIRQFLDYFDIDADISSMKVTYYRILSELKDSEKSTQLRS